MAALALLAAPVHGQTVPSPPATASVTPPTAPAAPVAPHPHVTMDERFTKANTTHDGHLTLAQAKLGYAMVAKHFTEIDAKGRGYVTEDDIHAWEKAERDRHHTAQQPTAPPPKT
jgi:hypothetical protein